MKPPFTTEQFLEVFRNYNNAVYPAQIIFYVLAAIVLFMIGKKPLISGKMGSAYLAFLWLWMGIIYHILFFTPINKAAYIFGAVFILQGLLIGYFGIMTNRLSFRFQADAYGITGAVFILFALVLYPLLGYAIGHVYPSNPTFGLPCPTTIFTFGLFLWTHRQFPKVLLIIPFLWSLVGFSAAFALGIVEDTGLLLAGLIGTGMLMFRKKKWKSAVVATLLGMCFFPLKAQQSYQITFVHDDKIVYGTFTTPVGTGPFPTIIINPGSGANDRDGTIPVAGGNFPCLYPGLVGDTLRPYKQLGDALADSGYAVLRYDKLEFTYTPAQLGPITFHKVWLPVESAIDYVKTRTDVDTNRIILIGHSEGSTLIPFIAKGRSDVKALISLAGPRTPIDSLLAYQLLYITRECGGDTNIAHIQANQILAYFNVIRTNTWTILTPALFGVPASAWYDYILAIDSVAINYNLNNLPTLFIGFGLDLNVPPAELDRFESEVIVTDDFWRLPGLVHFMTPADDPDIPMELSDTIIYWLRQQGIQSGTNDRQRNHDAILNISPNPFSASVTIHIHNLLHNDGRLYIRDAKGALFMTKAISPVYGDSVETLDLSSLPPGSYYIELKMGAIQVVKQIVKLE